MLGGNFWIAFLRNTIGAGTIMTVFLMLDRPRVSMKKAFLYYAGFGLLTIITFSIWYFLDWKAIYGLQVCFLSLFLEFFAVL